jgi:2-aminoethylphosphonate transport system permease protein
LSAASASSTRSARVSSRERRRAILGQAHLWFLALGILGPLILYPLCRLLWLSVAGAHGLSLDAYAKFLTDPDTLGILETTFAILIVSAGIASLLGVILAALLFFFPLPGTVILIRFLELFVAFPSFLVAFTLIFLYGTQGAVSIALHQLFGLPRLDFLFGTAGVVLAEVIFYTPFVVRPTLAAFSLLDRRLIEAASSLGAEPAMVARRIVLPLAWPGIAAGSILCFLLTLNEFGILLVLGSAQFVTLPVAIYSAATVDLDLRAASAEAVVMLAISFGLYTLYRLADRRVTAKAR